MNLEERFWSKINKKSQDECWPWLASKMHRGYGQFKTKTTVVRVHRFVYELVIGPIPAGMQIDHTCHNPNLCKLGDKCPHRSCCNPNHLRLVTNAENHKSDRVNAAAGGYAAMGKMTPEQRKERAYIMNEAKVRRRIVEDQLGFR